MNKKSFSTLALVLAMAAGTAGATLLAGEVSADAKPATHKVVVRPVTAKGHAAKGYRVVKQSRTIECYDPSNGAVDKGIAFCGSGADYTPACWRSATPHRVLCLPDPTKKVLQSIKLKGTFPTVSPVRHPQPQALRLAGGKVYEVRVGGAAEPLKQHPSWVEVYFTGNTVRNAIYGPQHSPINTRHARWIVTTFATPNSHGKRHDVASAYYVGTAR